MSKPDTLDAIAREIQQTIDQRIFGSNGEVDAYLRGIVRKLTALSNQGEGAVACFRYVSSDGDAYNPFIRDWVDGAPTEMDISNIRRHPGVAFQFAYLHPSEADRRDAERDPDTSLIVALADEMKCLGCCCNELARTGNAIRLAVVAQRCMASAPGPMDEAFAGLCVLQGACLINANDPGDGGGYLSGYCAADGHTAEKLTPIIELLQAAMTSGDAKDAARYRALRKMTPYRLKKIQDASTIDATDTLYFDGAKFDAAIDAATQEQT